MRIIRSNKEAYFDFSILDTIEAGLVLTGSEVKQIKVGHCMIKQSIVQVQGGELRVVNMDIPLYAKASVVQNSGYDPKARRKLLTTKKQRTKLVERTKKTGLTILPLKIIENKKGQIKLLIGLGKRKKKIEKKAIIRERDTKRQMAKEIKNYK